MSLLSYYDNRNMVTDTGLSVSYRQQFNGAYWEITRLAKKSYRFIAMTKDTAYACASAKRTQYTRSFKRITEQDDGEGGTTPTAVTVIECPSDIAPQHDEGGAWSVQISVNEEDVIPSASASNDPASLFATENGRNYDEDAGAANLTLNSATRSGNDLTVTYTCGVAGYNEAGVIIQYKASESATTWTSAGSVIAQPAYVPAAGALIVRLIYGSLESNTVTVS